MKNIPNTSTDVIKKKIVELFYKNVKGKTPDTSSSNLKHSGKEGHWLEVQMGVSHNASNSPDIDGFEMKNNTSTKTSFGDWSADYYVFNDPKYAISRNDFLRYFGKANIKKNGRYSWSGEPCPRIGQFNNFGQILYVDKDNNILAVYSYFADKRPNKNYIIPEKFKQNDLILAMWKHESMKRKLERKFNKLGWFKCLKNKNGIYTNIVFGRPIRFVDWIENVKTGIIFFDSGMYEGNIRPYSQWRANNLFWEKLVVETY